MKYADRRYWVLPPYWSDARLTQISTEFWDTPTNIDIERRARNACRAYAAWNPPESLAIGYHSVSDMFAQMDGSTNPPKCLIHK